MSIELLKECDKKYYSTGTSELSDIEYDKLKRIAHDESPNDPYFKTVGSEPKSRKVNLPYVMGSLKKKKADGTTEKWLCDEQCSSVIVSDKMDGCSIYVEYNLGEVTFAATRGNGSIGQDITEKAKIFMPRITSMRTFHIKGEATLPPETARTISDKHPRNITAGILNRDDYTNAELIVPVMYGILNINDTIYDQLLTLDELGFNTPYFSKFSVNGLTEEILSKLLLERKENSIIDIDGLVICDESFTQSDEYYPENAVAFKVNEEAVETTVLSVERNTTRTGKVTPVVLINPVEIGGSTISRVTGFNEKYILDKGIGEGAVIGIVKSGDIIPYIVDVYTKSDKVSEDVYCPSCDNTLVWTNTKVDLICDNPKCAAQVLCKIEHFLVSHDVEEMGIPTIKQIGVDSIEDLFELDEFDLIGLDGIGSRKSSIILNQIKKVLKTTPDKLLKSFGVSGIGGTISKVLIDKWDFDTLFTLTEADFISIDGIGDILASNIVIGLQNNIKLYKYLLSKGLVFKEQSTSLKGTIFTFTGKSEFKRNDLIKMVDSVGGSVKGISKKTNYLVTNDVDSQSGKAKKARQYGIEIITYDNLMEMIGE